MQRTSLAFKALFFLSLLSFYGLGCPTNDVPETPYADYLGILKYSTDNGVTWNDKVHPFADITDLEILPYNGGVYVIGDTLKDTTFLSRLAFRRSINDNRGTWDDVPAYRASIIEPDIEVQARYKVWITDREILRYLQSAAWLEPTTMPGVDGLKFTKFLWSNDQYGICVGSPGAGFTQLNLFYTTDGGESWIQTTSGEDIHSFKANGAILINDSTFIVTTESLNELDGIVRSTDQGRTWESISDDQFISITADRTSQTCFALNDNNQIYRSTDRGSLWQLVEMPESPDPEATSTYYSQIENAGNGMWVVAETNVIYDESAHQVKAYKYYIRRMTGDNLTETSRTKIFESTKPYNFKLVKADKQDHQVIYTFLALSK